MVADIKLAVGFSTLGAKRLMQTGRRASHMLAYIAALGTSTVAPLVTLHGYDYRTTTVVGLHVRDREFCPFGCAYMIIMSKFTVRLSAGSTSCLALAGSCTACVSSAMWASPL